MFAMSLGSVMLICWVVRMAASFNMDRIQSYSCASGLSSLEILLEDYIKRLGITDGLHGWAP